MAAALSSLPRHAVPIASINRYISGSRCHHDKSLLFSIPKIYPVRLVGENKPALPADPRAVHYILIWAIGAGDWMHEGPGLRIAGVSRTRLDRSSVPRNPISAAPYLASPGQLPRGGARSVSYLCLPSLRPSVRKSLLLAFRHNYTPRHGADADDADDGRRSRHEAGRHGVQGRAAAQPQHDVNLGLVSRVLALQTPPPLANCAGRSFAIMGASLLYIYSPADRC